MRVEVARLRGQILDDREAAARQFDRLAGLSGFHDDPGALARAAIALHHAYSAIEAVLERCAVVLEGSRPGGPTFHRELLDGAARELPGVRPALIGRDTARRLHELLSFRHFFHHAYDTDLDAERIEDLIASAAALRAPLDADLDRLDGWLERVATAEPPA